MYRSGGEQWLKGVQIRESSTARRLEKKKKRKLSQVYNHVNCKIKKTATMRSPVFKRLKRFPLLSRLNQYNHPFSSTCYSQPSVIEN